MTVDKSSLYWKSKPEWYFINEDGNYELTNGATDRAIESFKIYNGEELQLSYKQKRIYNLLNDYAENELDRRLLIKTLVTNESRNSFISFIKTRPLHSDYKILLSYIYAGYIDEINYKMALIGKLKERYDDRDLALAIIANLHSEKKYKIMSEYLEIEQDLSHDDILIVSVVLSKSKVRSAKKLFAEMQMYVYDE